MKMTDAPWKMEAPEADAPMEVRGFWSVFAASLRVYLGVGLQIGGQLAILALFRQFFFAELPTDR